jgi:class 3 adenylate cyclase
VKAQKWLWKAKMHAAAGVSKTVSGEIPPTRVRITPPLNERIRAEVERFRGSEINTTGDGFLAAFDGPARAIRCTRAAVDSVKGLGIDIRAGLHTGECERLAAKLGGIAVHVGARVAAHAQAGEVLVSATVKDLVAGSGIEFRDLGHADLKGVGERQLFAVVAA